MEERGNKTIMCSVLFLDIVAYSKQSVSAQIAQKELFNTMLANAIKNVPVNDRVILDTGDGAAITFLGDVEDALKAVLAFRDSLLNEGASMEPPLQVCMGVNLGPVRLVKDINGQPNIVGDGINVAQRIMGFAKPGEILVSRSYFDAASRLSQEYAGMFYNKGLRTDKHVREHEVYAIGHPGEATAKRLKAGEDTLGIAVNQSFLQVVDRKLRLAFATFQDASGQQRALYAGVAASALALLIMVTVKIVHRPEAPAPQVAVEAPQVAVEPTTPAVASSVSAVAPLATAESGVKAASQKTDEASTKIAESKETKKAKTSHHPDTSAEQPKDSKHLSSGHTSAKASEANPRTMAHVTIAVAPWGEVFLDGKNQGVSPPLDGLYVTPGEHAIEIRNTTFPPYTLKIQVKADEQMKIKHKFGN